MAKQQQQSFMESQRVMQVPVGAIRPNPGQPRRIFEENGLQELAHSIASFGILQPLTVRRRSDGYELVAGERRLRAAKLAGLPTVPCILMRLDEAQSGIVALVENLQRRDLDYIEEAEGIARLMRLYGLSQEQAAIRIGKSQSAVANKLRLLRHTAPVRDALREHKLSERHARALLKLPSENARLEAIEFIARKNMTVANAENYIDTLMTKRTPRQDANGVTDVGQFLQTVDHSLRLMKNAGLAANSSRREDEREIILTIRIPKMTG